jgi:hypothetical protein
MSQPTSYITQIIDVAYEQYNRLDAATTRLAGTIMGCDVSVIDTKDSKLMFVSGALKIAAVALIALGAYTLIQYPFLLLASVCAGAIVRPEKQTRASIESWVADGYTKVIVPITQNESMSEKLALCALGVAIAAATLTTVIAPVALGIYGGYKLANKADGAVSA